MSWLEELDKYKRHLSDRGVPKRMAEQITLESIGAYIQECVNDETWLDRVERRNPRLLETY